MANPTVNHFEILADDLKRAVDFYKTVFGWEIKEWENTGYFLVDTGEKPEVTKEGKTFTIGINGAIMKRDSIDIFSQKGSGFVCYVGVDDFEETAGKIKNSGGKQISDRQDMEGIGATAYFEDTEGNIFGIIQPDPRGM